jgi:hypothetical protein
MKWTDLDYKWVVAFGVLGFFCLISLYAIEIPYFNRYFSFAVFLTYSEIFGVLLGGLAAWYFGKSLADSYDRMRLRIGLVVAGLIFGPLVFSLMNRWLDPWPRNIELVEFAGTEARVSSRFGIPDPEEAVEGDTYHIYFYRKDQLKRIVFNRKPNLENVQEGDQIGLLVRKGLFGLEWVQSVQSGENTPSII